MVDRFTLMMEVAQAKAANFQGKGPRPELVIVGAEVLDNNPWLDLNTTGRHEDSIAGVPVVPSTKEGFEYEIQYEEGYE